MNTHRAEHFVTFLRRAPAALERALKAARLAQARHGPPPDPATVESLFSRVRFPLMSHAFLTGQVPPRRRGRRRPVPHPRAMP